MTQAAKACPFCNPPPQRIVIEGVVAMTLWDSYPLNPGHVLIVPRRHVASWFEATAAEREEMLRLADDARRKVIEKHSPDGFNLGINDGPAAGQTVPLFRLQLLRGDQRIPILYEEAKRAGTTSSVIWVGRGDTRIMSPEIGLSIRFPWRGTAKRIVSDPDISQASGCRRGTEISRSDIARTRGQSVPDLRVVDRLFTCGRLAKRNNANDPRRLRVHDGDDEACKCAQRHEALLGVVESIQDGGGQCGVAEVLGPVVDDAI